MPVSDILNRPQPFGTWRPTNQELASMMLTTDHLRRRAATDEERALFDAEIDQLAALLS